MENLTKEISKSIEAEVLTIDCSHSDTSPEWVYQAATGLHLFRAQSNITNQVTTLGALLNQTSTRVGLKGKWVAFAANAAVYGYASFKTYEGNTVILHGHYLNAIFIAN